MPPPRQEAGLAALEAEWAAGRFAPVYLLAGPDTLQKEDALVSLTRRFLPGPDAGLHTDRLDGESASAGSIVTAARTLPFLGGRRLILVRRAHDLGSADLGRLADGLGNLPAGNCLVLLWDEKPDARGVLYQAVKSAGTVAVFWPPFENQLPRWVADRARARGKTMDLAAARALVEAVGGSPADLAQEVDKLVLYVKDRPAVTAEEVLRVAGGGQRALQFMEWERALWRRDRKSALGLMTHMKARGQAPESLLVQAARAFQKLALGKAFLAAKNTDRAELWNRLWIRTREPQEDFLRAAEGMTWDDLLDVLESFADAEEKMKTGRLDPESGLTLLVCGLTR
jgi:DNA polymerase-3 subunit delta